MTNKHSSNTSSNRSSRKRRRRNESQYRELALKHSAKVLLDKAVKSVEYPGGPNRESYRLILDDNTSVIGSRRDTVEKARRETAILQALSAHTAAVPKLIATNHSQILFQEEKLGERFSLKISQADGPTYLNLMDAALSSLNSIHIAAREEKLSELVNPIGYQSHWLNEFAQRPRVIGEYLNVNTPELDYSKITQLLKPTDEAFVKWDTRPGNALVTSAGSVVWFDWEHAGSRNRLDDVAWIMADEFVPDMPQQEAILLDKYLPLFSSDQSKRLDYLMTYGTCHMLVRLGLILKFKDGDWWDINTCIENDKIGVTLQCADWICLKGARWSKQSTLLAPLSDWFNDVRTKIHAL